MDDITIISIIIPIIISFIALIVSIYKLSVDKHSAEKQLKSNKEMVDMQLEAQREMYQKQLDAQKETVGKQLITQKEAFDKQLNNQKEIFEKQFKVQQEIIIIMRKEMSILESGLKEISIRKEPSNWEMQIRKQELELKQKKEAWNQVKDVAKFIQFITEE